MRDYNRREFLKVMGCTVAAAAGAQLFTPRFLTSLAAAQSIPGNVQNVLHIYLSGGIDGMFLIGPLGDDFKRVRKDLYPDLSSGGATQFTSVAGRDLYMHKSLNTFFQGAWNRGELAVLCGAGLPLHPSQSHEDATRLMAAGANDGNSHEVIPFEQRIAGLNTSAFNGSLAYIDLSGGNTLSQPTGVYKCLSGSLGTFGFNGNIANSENRFRIGSFFASNRADGLSSPQLGALANWKVVEDSVAQVTAAVNSATVSPAFPNTNIGRQLREAFIAFTKLGTKAAGAVQGGYDTHANELVDLPARIGELAAALDIFYQNMARVGAWGNTAVVINSEFGRNVAMNNGKGCDHGIGNTHFVTGGAVRGQVLGAEIFTTENINSRRNAWPVTVPIAAYYKAIGAGMGLDVSQAFADYTGAPLAILR